MDLFFDSQYITLLFTHTVYAWAAEALGPGDRPPPNLWPKRAAVISGWPSFEPCSHVKTFNNILCLPENLVAKQLAAHHSLSSLSNAHLQDGPIKSQPRQYRMQPYILNGETDCHGSTLYRGQPSSVHDALTLPIFIWPAHFSDDFASG